MILQSIKPVHPRKFQKMFVKDWYISKYPDDKLGYEIDEKLRFEDVRMILDANMDIYLWLNVEDSIVRERVFFKLAELLNVDYDIVYNKWIESDLESFLKIF